MLAAAFVIFFPLLVVGALLSGLWRLWRLTPLRGIFSRYVFGYRLWLRGFDYREGQLIRASHGAAWCLLAAVIGLHLRETGNLDQAMLAILAVPVLWGAVAFFDGARKSRGEFDWYLGGWRAGLKATAGAVALYLLPAGVWLDALNWYWLHRFTAALPALSFPDSVQSYARDYGLTAAWVIYGLPKVLPSSDDLSNLGAALVLTAAWVVAFWCLVTGTAKVMLLLRGWERPRLPQTPRKDPARDATEEEAHEDMLGRGGRVTSLDQMEF